MVIISTLRNQCRSPLSRVCRRFCGPIAPGDNNLINDEPPIRRPTMTTSSAHNFKGPPTLPTDAHSLEGTISDTRSSQNTGLTRVGHNLACVFRCPTMSRARSR